MNTFFNRHPLTVTLSLVLLALFVAPLVNAAEADLENGEEINELCAGCHGEFGQGGKEGEYPRIAGQPEQFLIKQMHLFRDRKRPNMPMLEYVDERQFPDQEIIDISAYLARLELPTKLPPIQEGEKFNAHERLQLTKKLLNIARTEGDIEAGRKMYKRECRSCHGDKGWGKPSKGVPMIAGQYTSYLKRQVTKYINKVRIHDEDDPDEELLAEFSAKELQNIYAYLSFVDDE